MSERPKTIARPSLIPIVEPLEQRNFLSADLAVSLQSSPTALQPGATNHVALRITNNGDDVAVGVTRIAIGASSDSTIDPSDAQLISIDKTLHLKPGKGTVVKIPFASPTSVADGNYTLLAQLESDPAINDSNASNDVAAAAAPTAIRQPFVDLVGQFSDLPDAPLQAFIGGRNSCATVNVFNSGNVIASGPLSVSVYLSADGTLDASDIALGTSAAKQTTIRAGAGKNVKVTLSPPPAGTPVGTYSLIAVVDPANRIPERDETNNQTTSATQVPVVNTRPPSFHDHHNHGYYWTSGSDADTFYYFDDGDWYYPDEPVMVDPGNGGGSGGSTTEDSPPSDSNPSQPDPGTTAPSDPETQPTPDPDPRSETQPSEPPTTQPSEPDDSSNDSSNDGWDSGISDDWDWDF